MGEREKKLEAKLIELISQRLEVAQIKPTKVEELPSGMTEVSWGMDNDEIQRIATDLASELMKCFAFVD